MPLRKNSSTSARTTAPSSILLVDDNKLGLCARKSVLEELGHRCATAANGVDALEQFNDSKFDLVVTDYKMPRMNGLELIVGLRRITPDLPVILISGFVDSLGLSEENTGADVVIMKSANEVSHMVRAVARLLRKKPVRKPAGSESAAARAKRKSV
ncbi:MAG TPA: response regulator [Bryobacteraceae bacterium]|jgi:ATP-dependent Lon protease|nr:response regulator [Bryobacteraceae bacterium]